MRLDNVISVRSNKTVYRDGDKCIKVFNSDFSKADILNEALNQARIEETGLNTPKLYEVTMINGRWAIVSQFIEGTTLEQLIAEHPEKKSEYIELLVDLQMRVHRETCPLLNRLKDKMSRKIAQSDFEATTRFALYARLAETPKHRKICHGDFTPSNIIITKEGTPYILDWSHATQGNASADVARTYLSLKMSSSPEDAELYLDKFCEKSVTEKQYVYHWLPIVAAAHSKTDDPVSRNFYTELVNNPERY